MRAGLRITTGDDGRPLVVKEAGPGLAADRLAQEAALLQAARHPGVVELVRAEAHADGGYTLATRLGGTRTLADPPDDPDVVAGLVAAVAATLADLHGLGIVHGRVDAAHVVVGADGRPLLCGFAGGARDGSTPIGGSAPLAPADDVAALAALTHRLLATDDRRRASPGRQALLDLADRAQRAGAGGDGPTAAQFAAAVRAVAPGARLQHLPGRRLPRRSVLVAAGVALLAGLVVAAAWRPAPSTTERPIPLAAPPSPPSTVAPECEPHPPPVADPDGDGCADPVLIDGTVVTVGSRRFGVGEPTDHLVAGDWDCDGDATIAAVRPPTGEVFVFTRWSDPGGDLDIRPIAELPGVVGVLAAGGDCPTLTVVGADGAQTPVVIPP